MDDISNDLSMTVPIGLSGRAAGVLARALATYGECLGLGAVNDPPEGEAELVKKLQVELRNAVARTINERQDREERVARARRIQERAMIDTGPVRRIKGQGKPPTRPFSGKKPKSAAERMAEKMAEAGRAAVDKHKKED